MLVDSSPLYFLFSANTVFSVHFKVFGWMLNQWIPDQRVARSKVQDMHV